MIKFFRKIRQKLLVENRFNKYLLYAIGEIILVVIGILIALQINNWNEQQKIKSNEYKLLQTVLENIKTDSISIALVLNRISQIEMLHNQLIELNNGLITQDQIDNIDIIRWSSVRSIIIDKNNPNLSNLVLSESVKKTVLEHFKKIKITEHFFANFNELVENELRPYLGKQKLLNYGVKLNGTSSRLIRREAFFEDFKNEPLQQILFECNIKLSACLAVLKEINISNEELKQSINNYLSEI